MICFTVLGSTTVRGLSVAAISIGGHYSRKDGERASLIGAETEALYGMEIFGVMREIARLASVGMNCHIYPENAKFPRYILLTCPLLR